MMVTARTVAATSTMGAASADGLATAAFGLAAVGDLAQAPAQPPSGGAPPATQGPALARASVPVEPLPYADHTGFEQIFDGSASRAGTATRSSGGWSTGALVGESTPEKTVKPNTFLIWRGGEPKDFELKVEFRMNATNSGIQYRSVELPTSQNGCSKATRPTSTSTTSSPARFTKSAAAASSRCAARPPT